MINEKIQLENVGYTIRNDELAKYPEFKLIVFLGDNEQVLLAEPSFSLSDSNDIVQRMFHNTDSVMRIRCIGFTRALELVGYGLPFKNHKIRDALLECGFLTKDEVQDV